MLGIAQAAGGARQWPRALLGDALHVAFPTYTEARIEAADLTDVQLAEYRADLVVLLYDERPGLGVVVDSADSVCAAPRSRCLGGRRS